MEQCARNANRDRQTVVTLEARREAIASGTIASGMVATPAALIDVRSIRLLLLKIEKDVCPSTEHGSHRISPGQFQPKHIFLGMMDS